MTTGQRPISAWLIGGDSLLIECGEILLAAGYDLHGVVTSNPRLAEWARGKNLPVVDAGADYAAVMSGRPFDFLFSITHLALIPEAALRQPRRFAVNFHDGPLPRYAGLNTPAWALMRSEPTYGITWHVITSELDRGDILKQSLFDVSPRETALTMNTRCFEVAIDTFEQLVRELAEGRETRTPQPRDGFNYYSRTQRPAAACTIDWSRSAPELDALVRGLDFGRYTNPLGAPKVFHGAAVVAVTAATARPSTAAAAPGTILSVSGSEVVVRAGDGALAITGFSSLCGAPFSAAHAMERLGLRVGDRLDVLNPEMAKRLTDLGAVCAKSEPAWVKRLSTLEAADIPFRTGGGAGNGFGQIEMAIPSSFRERYAARGLADALTGAFSAFLWRSGEKISFDIAFRDGSLRTLANGVEGWVASRVPVRVSLDGAELAHKAIERMHDEMALARKRGVFLRDTVARHVELHNRHDLFDLASLSAGVEQAESLGAAMAPVHPLTLVVTADGSACRLDYDRSTISPEAAQQIRDRFGMFLERVASRAEAPLAQIDVLSEDERTRVLVEWNKTATSYPVDATINGLFEAQVARTPDAPAVAFDAEQLTYRELNERANRLAAHLRSLGVAPDSLVGIFIERSIELLVAVLATQKAGGAYVPLDPTYPRDRLAFMIEDARVPVILTSQSLAGELPPNRASVVRVDADWARIEKNPGDNLADAATASNLAYVIYTSGSTGKPKGVMIEHRNAVNFFTGMDERLPRQATSGGPQDVWLAVTSLSFDISVLELLWTVTRGLKVVIYSDGTKRKAPSGAASRTPGQPVGHTPGQLGFSLFYFASDEGESTSERYTLLLEGARFADRNGFAAVWTPERHFHAFGGLYPNPAVASAAIAGITERVGIRAGSVVLPLHHPARIAEEWALVDNLSRGRVAIAFASGWQPVDFVLRPEAYANRQTVLYDGIETVRKLWRGEAIEFPGPDGKQHAIRTLPRPIQPELPVWVTTAGNIDTWKSAGKVGANILTHLLGQTVEEVSAKVKAYRDARKEAGHAGDGVVTMMLHTFVGDDVDEVREIVRKPMKDYLASSISLVKNVASSWAALKKRSDGTQAAAAPDISSLSAEEMDGLLDFSFERYFETSGLFGTPQTCLTLVNRLREIGIDEIACLIDFGVPSQLALDHLRHLNQLRALACPEAGHVSASESAASRETSIGSIRRHGVTHIQCTPSMAGMILADDESRDALKTVRVMMIGGEAFPTALATDLAAATRARIINMYGPTETTIWSSTHVVTPGDSIPIGRPIANTTLYIVDRHMRPTPVGVPGELLIGGVGVARGYLNRPELTAERFIKDPFSSDSSSRLYRTGDVARYLPDGVVEFLGRGDHQVKIRGYRIELGEIESALSKHPQVKEAVVVPREDTPGDKRLVAYFIPAGDTPGSMELRTFMRERLPEFMVPSIFFAMKAFPQTPNRKVDRKALPSPMEPKAARPAGGAAVAMVGAPAGEFEQRIIRVWEDVLGLKTVGMDDNFFDLGGHSLLAVKAHRLLKEALQRDLAITDLFRFPTVRTLAGHLTQRGNDDSMDRSGSRGDSRRELLAARQSRLRGRGKSEDGA